jgi:hypothetical protein
LRGVDATLDGLDESEQRITATYLGFSDCVLDDLKCFGLSDDAQQLAVGISNVDRVRPCGFRLQLQTGGPSNASRFPINETLRSSPTLFPDLSTE